LDEASLISRAAQGDAAAWEPVVITHQEAVFRLAYLILGNPDDAQDVAQETFVRAWKNLGRFDRSRPLRPWLLRIAANLANNRRRSAARYFAALVRTVQVDADAPGIEEQGAQHIESQQLWQAVRGLGSSDQQILYLRYFLDLSVVETAETLQMAEGTVKSRSHRALDRLRTIIRRDFPTLGDQQAS
jgi:RNA polymerase sigma-70 factor (ECF subfamily)